MRAFCPSQSEHPIPHLELGRVFLSEALFDFWNLNMAQFSQPQGGQVAQEQGGAAALAGAQLIARIEHLIRAARVPRCGSRPLDLDDTLDLQHPGRAGRQRRRALLREGLRGRGQRRDDAEANPKNIHLFSVGYKGYNC